MESSSAEWLPSSCGTFWTYRLPLEKSISDHRQYRLIRLENQLEVVLISDPDTEISSAALDVHVGHHSDPKDCQGLAHFCEHLLFMGTEKYPKDNEYRKYLSDHSGQANAFTAAENTQYYFEIDQRYLEGALDRFSQFFINPLFAETCAKRELDIVNSEHNDNKQNDHWRKFQLEKSLSDPEHPFCNFGTGNHQTLYGNPKKSITDIRRQLLQFYKAYYSANIMKLCVLGKEPLDNLTGLVVEMFRMVPKRGINRPESPASPLTTNELLKQIYIKPVKNIRNIDIVFPFPDQYPLYASQPESYISRLIGHEGKGSLFSLFKNNGWANTLEVCVKHGGTGFAFYSISMDLTEQGQDHYKDIVMLVFQYITLIKETGIQESFFTEFQTLSRLDFDFNNDSRESAHVSDIAGFMQRNYPPHLTISASRLFLEYNPTTIKDNLNWLRPDNFRLLLTSQNHGVECTLREQWYGTEYQILELDSGFKEMLVENASNGTDIHPELHLPLPNKFIPLDYSVHQTNAKSIKRKPDLILDSPRLRLWMCAHMLDYSLNEYRDNAETAGLYFSLKGDTLGLELIIDGFNAKLPLLFNIILQTMLDIQFDPSVFHSLKEKLIVSFENMELEQPLTLASRHMSYLTRATRWSDWEMLYELRNLLFEDIELFYSTLLSEMQIEALVNGNILKQNAISLLSSAVEMLDYRPLSKSKLVQTCTLQSLMIPRGTRWVYQKQVLDPGTIDSGVLYMVQIGSQDNKWERTRLSLVAHIAREPFFNQLRTKEHLGYTVFSKMNIEAGHTTYRLMVQKSLVHQKLERSKSLGQEGDKYWTHIRSGLYDFERDQEDAAELKRVTKHSLVGFIKHYIDPGSAYSRGISIHIQSHKNSSSFLNPGIGEYSNRAQECLFRERNMAESDKIDD
ncbi:Metalloenzyme, LuxS/M16 peptidase-like protein [Phycomyces nitens]|nr:Metalloenzyme, LuxS/M16 peptidase-like protein [Phycomyces nitens]